MDKSKKGRAAKEKGARGERMLVKFFEKFGLTAKRGFVWMNQSDLIGLDGIHVECKNVEKLNVRQALSQAIEEAGKRKDGLPTVFWHKSRCGWVTIMRTEDWIVLYKLARSKHDTMRTNPQIHEGE